MALIHCPDCGTDHSSQAKACPKCARPGAPEKPSMLQREAESAVNVVKGIVMFMIVGALVLFGLCVVATLMDQ